LLLAVERRRIARPKAQGLQWDYSRDLRPAKWGAWTTESPLSPSLDGWHLKHLLNCRYSFIAGSIFLEHGERVWVTCSGEQNCGGFYPMNPDWARAVRDQCAAAGVPFNMLRMSRGQPSPRDLLIRPARMI
jgi:hypothetical protein